MTYALVRTTMAAPSQMDLVTFARLAGLHPEYVRRLVALGVLEPHRDAADELRFTGEHLLAVARVQRLRAGLGLNYAAIGLVIDLLDRVTELERELRKTTSRHIGERPWT
jgi:chaperone modulatory protein CbpM